MQKIPDNIKAQYESLLFEKGVPRINQNSYMKWLRYYLDFCYEYHHESSSKGSLPYFLQKLQDKKQNNQQQRQASDAISLYYEIALSNYKNKIATKNKYNESIRKQDQFKLTNAACKELKERS